METKRNKGRLKKPSFLVGVTGFEPAASCSQSRRATNCATPRFFYFAFFLKSSLLCPPAIQLAQADHGTCVILIYPARFVKRVIGWATVAAPSALIHTQRKIPPLWLTPGRWYSLGAKISPGTTGWTGSGHRYPAARLRWSCLRSPGAWPAARQPKRLHRS